MADLCNASQRTPLQPVSFQLPSVRLTWEGATYKAA